MFITDAMRNLPTSDDDKYAKVCHPCTSLIILLIEHASQLSASSVALDLAPLSQSFVQRGLHNNSLGKSSEWPQFSGSLRGSETFVAPTRPEQRRNVTTPSGPLGGLGPAFHEAPSSKLNSSLTSAGSSNHVQHHPNDSRHGSPHGISETLSSLSSITTARSVPATPIGPVPVRPDIPNLVKTPSTPATNSTNSLVTPGFVTGSQFTASTLNDNQSELFFLYILFLSNNALYVSVPLSFGSIQHNLDDTLQVRRNNSNK